MMKIASASPEDIPIVAELEKQLYPQPWSQKDFETLLGDEAFWFWVARKDEEIVGYLVCQVVQSEAELHNIAVAKNFQRQKVGTFLFQKLTDELKRKGIHEIYLMVRGSNLAAQKLYAKFRFKKIGIRPQYYNHPKEDAFVFRLSIEA